MGYIPVHGTHMLNVHYVYIRSMYILLCPLLVILEAINLGYLDRTKNSRILQLPGTRPNKKPQHIGSLQRSWMYTMFVYCYLYCRCGAKMVLYSGKMHKIWNSKILLSKRDCCYSLSGIDCDTFPPALACRWWICKQDQIGYLNWVQCCIYIRGV